MKFFSNECLKPNLPKEDTAGCHVWCPILPSRPQPPQRSKHAVASDQRKVYMYGGRGKYGPLHDLWSFDIDTETWTDLGSIAIGKCPGNLEGHSMVAFGNCLYIFGGKICSSEEEISFWKFSILDNSWTHLLSEKNVLSPSSRREHSAVIYDNAIYIFGGFKEVFGATSELWLYDFASESWHLDAHASRTHPAARYGHSAVVHGEKMWICGGLTGLLSTSEVWSWHFVDRMWTNIKYKNGPLELHGQCAAIVGWNMYVFGGTSKSGVSKQELWKFSLWRQIWEKCSFSGFLKPEEISGHAMISFVEFSDSSKKRTRSVPMIKSKKSNLGSNHSLQPPRKVNSVSPDSQLFYKRPKTSPAGYHGKNNYSLLGNRNLQKEDYCYEQPIEIIDLEASNINDSMQISKPLPCEEDERPIQDELYCQQNQLKFEKFIQSFNSAKENKYQYFSKPSESVPLKNMPMNIINGNQNFKIDRLKDYSYNLKNEAKTIKLNSSEAETSFIKLNILPNNQHRVITTDEISVQPAPSACSQSYVRNTNRISTQELDTEQLVIEKPELLTYEKPKTPNKFDMNFELSLLIIGGKTDDTMSSVALERPVKLWKCQNCKCDD